MYLLENCKNILREIIMDYEMITESLIQKIVETFNLEDVYQEFLDSLIKCNNFENFSNEEFRKYLDNRNKI